MIRWRALKSLSQVQTIHQRCGAVLKMPSTLVRHQLGHIVRAEIGLIHVTGGLFAPRAGQNFRDEQRRRRSQYDRGTRLAELEDSYRFSQRLSRFRHAVQHVY